MAWRAAPLNMVLDDLIKNVTERVGRIDVGIRLHVRAHVPSVLMEARLRAGQEMDGRPDGAAGSNSPITLCYVPSQYVDDVWVPRARTLGARARRCIAFPSLRGAREETGETYQ